ncbi:MAG: hypothetical protein ACK5PB_00575 [Pirellula sp.]
MRNPKFLRILENLKEFEHYRDWLIEVKVIERNDVALTTPESTRYDYDLQGQTIRHTTWPSIQNAVSFCIRSMLPAVEQA